jgi:formylglycine-generating enzyme required for sulfatase activity
MNEYLTPRRGFALLCVIVAVSAIWLGTRGRDAVAMVDPLVPELSVAPDLSRFRRDAWYLPNEAELGFVPIPAGPATIGSDPEVDRSAYANERWSATSFQGQIELPMFYIGRYEVTVAQYRAFLLATRRPFARESLSAPPTHPVTHVTWVDATAYSSWLESELKSAPTIAPQLATLINDGWKITLPSEAQWEKAARGGDGRIYPWGDTPDRLYANFEAANTVPVGSLKCPSCAFGLSDMSGNVWEFTTSPNVSYPFVTGRPAAPEADALYVMRGGSFGDRPNNIRAAIRGGVDPGARSPMIGFRVVLSKPE